MCLRFLSCLVFHLHHPGTQKQIKKKKKQQHKSHEGIQRNTFCSPLTGLYYWRCHDLYAR